MGLLRVNRDNEKKMEIESKEVILLINLADKYVLINIREFFWNYYVYIKTQLLFSCIENKGDVIVTDVLVHWFSKESYYLLSKQLYMKL